MEEKFIPLALIGIFIFWFLPSIISFVGAIRDETLIVFGLFEKAMSNGAIIDVQLICKARLLNYE